MTTIVTRAGKGSPLTHTEVDTNFTNLNTAKLEAGAIALGSAATPSISFTGDLNTGIFSPGADQLAVATNGTGRLFVDASGNIGVGVTPIDVAGYNSIQIGDTNGTYFDFFANATHEARILSLPGDLRINQITSGTLGLYTNNTERLRITSAGLVGIGTSSPGATCEIYSSSSRRMRVGETPLYTPADFATLGGSLTLSRANDNRTDVHAIYGYDTAAAAFNNLAITSRNQIIFMGNGSERMRIDDSGRLGIGTTSPGSPLTIESNAGNQVKVTYPSVASYYLNVTSGGALAINKDGTEYSRWDSSGRLLVGTSSAGAGTVNAASIVGSTLNQSTGLRTLSSGGTLDLNLLGTAIVGHLYVTSTLTANASVRTNTIFFITTRQGNATTITSLNSADGSSGGRSFTITNPSANIFRFTDTSSSACTVSMSFVGGIGF